MACTAYERQAAGTVEGFGRTPLAFASHVLVSLDHTEAGESPDFHGKQRCELTMKEKSDNI